MWYLVIFHVDVGEQGSTTFRVLIILQHLGIATLTTRSRYHGSLVLTALYLLDRPILSLTLTRGSGHRTLVQGTLWTYTLGQTWNQEVDETQDGHGPGFW